MREFTEEQIATILRLVSEGGLESMLAKLGTRMANHSRELFDQDLLVESEAFLKEATRRLGLFNGEIPSVQDPAQLEGLGEVLQVLSPDPQIDAVLQSLLRAAQQRDTPAVAEACAKFIKDLLGNPQPTPRVLRQCGAGPLFRLLGAKPPSIYDTDQARDDKLKRYWSVLPKVVEMRLRALDLQEYSLNGLPEHLGEFRWLVDGDFVRVLTMIVALTRIEKGKAVTYETISELLTRNKVKEISGSRWAHLVEGCDDIHHLRNSIDHSHFEIVCDEPTPGQVLITFTDPNPHKKTVWEKKLSLVELEGVFWRVRWLNELAVARFATEGPADLKRALSKHWDPEFLSDLAGQS